MTLVWLAALVATGPYNQNIEQRLDRLRSARGKPDAAVELLGLEEMYNLVAPERLFALAKVGDSKKAHPLVRTAAKTLRAALEQRDGRFDRARELRRQAGFLTQVRVAGPFDNQGGSGFSREEDLSSTSTPWRVPPDMSVSGAIPLGAMFEPNENRCAIVETFVLAKRAQKAALSVGSSGPVALLVGTEQVLSRDVERPMHPDQDTVAIRLGRGWNRVLAKSCVRSGPWGIVLRLSDARGDALVLPASADPPTQLADKGGLGRHPVASLSATLKARAEKSPDSFAAWNDWSRFLLMVSPTDPREREAYRALERAAALGTNAQATILFARSTDQIDERRRILEKANQAGIVSSRLLVELGDTYRDLERPRLARAAWEKASVMDRLDAVAALRLAEDLESLGLQKQALAQLLELEKRFSDCWLIGHAVASRLKQADRLVEAEQRLLKHSQTVPGDASGWRMLGEVEHAMGRPSEAIRAAQGWVAASPSSIFAALELADLQAGAGHLDEALATLHKAERITGEDVHVWEKQARLLLRLEKREAATVALKRALELRPQDADLRKYLEHIQPGGPALLDRFLRPIPSLLTQMPTQTQTDPAEVLWDLTAVEVHKNGLSHTLRQRVVRILDHRGAEQQAETLIRYSPSDQSVQVRAAKIHRQGHELESASQFDRDLSEPGTGLFYDYQAHIIRFSDLRPGDVIELEWTQEDRATNNFLGDHYGELFLLQEDIPRRASSIVLVAPEKQPLYFNQPNLPNLTRQIESLGSAQGKQIIYRFSAAETPPIEVEQGMPGWTEVAAYLHASTFQNWQDLAQWYRGFIRDSVVPDQAIRQAARAAVADIPQEPDHDPERVRRIYQQVLRDTRYVGLEFGIHGYLPYRLPLVWARKFGDCKDKASLLVAMLEEIGIPATMVLLRTRPRGNIASLPPSLAAFDHAIAYVPELKLYLDATAEFNGATELPWQDQGVPVLRIEDGLFTETPVFPAEQNHVARDSQLLLRASGAALSADLTETLTLKGQAAPTWRAHYQAADQHRVRYERALRERFVDAQIHDLQMAVEDLSQPVTVQVHANVPFQRFALPSVASESHLVRTYARASSRKSDLVLDYPWLQEEHFRYQVDGASSLRILSVPKNYSTSSPFGEFSLTVARNVDVVDVHVRLKVTSHRIARADYAAFRAFLADVDRALASELVVARLP